MGSIAAFFETGEQTSQKGHFRNLVLIARYDGVILDKENNLLNKIAQRLSITDEQVKEILENSDSYPVIPPYSREERYERFIQLIQMAMIDGVMSHEELIFVKHIGISLGFSDETIESKTKVIIDKVNSGLSKDEILESIL